MFWNLLLGCGFDTGITEDGVSGSSDPSGFYDCASTLDTRIDAYRDGELSLSAVGMGTRLPVVHEDGLRWIRLVVDLDLPATFGAVDSTLATVDGEFLGSGTVAQSAGLSPGRPCWRRFDGVEIEVPAEVPFDGMPLVLDLQLDTDVGPAERHLIVFGSDPEE